MTTLYILLSCSLLNNILTGLALMLLPFLLGWLAASAYHKVGDLRNSVASLTASNTDLNAQVGTLSAEGTDLRVKLTQHEAELESRATQLSKLKNDLIIAQGERNTFEGKLRECEANAAGGGGTAKVAAAPIPVFLFAGKKYKQDDLKIVEGIGPKIEELLHSHDIKTWKALSETDPERLKEILVAAGPNFQIHDPGTWPAQAGMADRGEWDALKKWQDELDAGKTA
jgi:predicted flap endonuclease-1-like 5' DNA nuclease